MAIKKSKDKQWTDPKKVIKINKSMFEINNNLSKSIVKDYLSRRPVSQSKALTIYEPPPTQDQVRLAAQSRIKKDPTARGVARKMFKDIKKYNRNIGATAKTIGTSIGSKITPIINSRAGKVAARGGKLLGKIVKGATWSGPKKLRNFTKALPTAIKRTGLFGTVLLGATAMLGLGMMKGAMNQSRDIVYERYMQDQAVGKNMLNNTRLGVSAGTSRMQSYGHTTGLSNSLSRTRHG